MCTISAGKASVLHLTENADGSASYQNATLRFSVFPTASFGTENEPTQLLESGPFRVLDDCKPGVGDCGCIASNRLDAVPIAFRYLPGHRPRRSAPGMDHSPMYGEALQCIQNYLIA